MRNREDVGGGPVTKATCCVGSEVGTDLVLHKEQRHFLQSRGILKRPVCSPCGMERKCILWIGCRRKRIEQSTRSRA